jgi:hypothetical protein
MAKLLFWVRTPWVSEIAMRAFAPQQPSIIGEDAPDPSSWQMRDDHATSGINIAATDAGLHKLELAASNIGRFRKLRCKQTA